MVVVASVTSRDDGYEENLVIDVRECLIKIDPARRILYICLELYFVLCFPSHIKLNLG